jgi:hypothetical protein
VISKTEMDQCKYVGEVRGEEAVRGRDGSASIVSRHCSKHMLFPGCKKEGRILFDPFGEQAPVGGDYLD